MNPQPRGIIPPEHAATIRLAQEQLAAAKAALEAAIVAGLLAGGSVREVADLTGMSPTTIQRIGHDGGWPSKAYKRARAESRRRNREWAELIERGLAQWRRMRPDEDE